jgi:hypothetical protein
MVFADAMIELGDPRGEFVQLQLQRDASAVQRRREKELLAAHRRAWLGELQHIIRRCEFERGFLASCELIPDNRELARRLAGRPAWSTVHTLAGCATIALHREMRELRTLDFDARVAAAVEQHPAAWEELLLGDARPIETLRYGAPVGDPGEVAALASCRALPQLRSLAAQAPRTTQAPQVRAWAEAILAGTAARRVAELELVFSRDLAAPLGMLGGLLERASAPTLRLAITGEGWRLACTLTAPADRSYRAAHLELTGNPSHMGLWGGAPIATMQHAIDVLPPTALDVTVVGNRIERGERTRIDAGIVRRGGRVRFV